MIKIIDAICGAGKTNYAIQMINENPEKKYIYITPFLDEINKRIKMQCNNFCSPAQLGEGKFNDFHKLLIQGKNVASTHALFRMATQETKDLIEGNGYCLILDEVMDVLEELPLKKDDLPTILSNNYAHIDEQGFLIWDDKSYSGRYDDVKTMCENKSIFVVNNCALMWTFPVEVFQSFKEVYVLTYMFSSQLQRYYYDLHNVDYEYFKVVGGYGDYSIEPHDGNFGHDLKQRIHIYEGALNDIGIKSNDLSKGWYEKHKYTKVKILKNNVYNYFRNIAKSKSNDNLWTTFKNFRDKVKGKGFANGFLSSNARSTNEFRYRTNIAYTVNKYMSPMTVQFFDNNGITVDQNGWALSELIQFIFRGAIRNTKGVREINLYIPSVRMRGLLKEFLG